MIDWNDPNIPYLLMGLFAFWAPVLGYFWSLRSRERRLQLEAALLQEELDGQA